MEKVRVGSWWVPGRFLVGSAPWPTPWPTPWPMFLLHGLLPPTGGRRGGVERWGLLHGLLHGLTPWPTPWPPSSTGLLHGIGNGVGNGIEVRRPGVEHPTWALIYL